LKYYAIFPKTNKMQNIIKISLILLALSFLMQCSPVDPVTGERVRIEPNVDQRARDAATKSGGIMGIIGSSKDDTNFRFTTSNVLWRATFKSLEFMPLLNADYSGGIIITDWYTEKPESKEAIKITVRFLSNELRSDSIVVIAHKRDCQSSERCQTILLSKKFSQDIKDSIMSNARSLKIEDEKKKK
jgi:hypothetical protein